MYSKKYNHTNKQYRLNTNKQTISKTYSLLSLCISVDTLYSLFTNLRSPVFGGVKSSGYMSSTK